MEEKFTIQELKNWIQKHEEEMLEDIRALVEIPSISEKGDEENPYGIYCTKVLKKNGGDLYKLGIFDKKL